MRTIIPRRQESPGEKLDILVTETGVVPEECFLYLVGAATHCIKSAVVLLCAASVLLLTDLLLIVGNEMGK